jgi:hypothetical protein
LKGTTVHMGEDAALDVRALTKGFGDRLTVNRVDGL